MTSVRARAFNSMPEGKRQDGIVSAVVPTQIPKDAGVESVRNYNFLSFLPLRQQRCNGRGALAENPDVALAVGERDREGRERPHCLPAILSWNQF